LRVGVVSASEVSVVAGNDGVFLTLLDVLTIPLSDARATGIGQNQPPYLLQWFILWAEDTESEERMDGEGERGRRGRR
jgi:hypothetical protein